MAFSQKTWTDRIAEYITRRTLTKTDGTTEVVTVERNEGEVSQEGDAFSASNMNDLEERIASEFTSVNENLSELEEKVNTSSLGTRVDISSYNSTSNQYTCPSDGYVSLVTASSSVGQRVTLYINGIIAGRSRCVGSGYSEEQCVFVKKGMKINRASDDDMGSMYFYPLTNS